MNDKLIARCLACGSNQLKQELHYHLIPLFGNLYKMKIIVSKVEYRCKKCGARQPCSKQEEELAEKEFINKFHKHSTVAQR